MTMTREQIGGCDVRRVQSLTGTEYYITATPGTGDAGRQAAGVYGEIARILRETGAAIVEERVFATPDAMAPAMAARAVALRGLDDGVAPTMLIARDESAGLLGVQVHAISGVGEIRVLRHDGGAVARTFGCDGYRYLTASGLTAGESGDAPAQAHAVFTTADRLLKEASSSFFDVARTWIWMDDVLSWYPQLNQVRNRFFAEQGLTAKPGHLPASTGIGVSPARGRGAMDVFASWGKPDAVTRFHAAGNQRSAYEYGSAFARASRVKTPGGQTVFCSGTAAIDPAGKTCFLNDIPGQVNMTVENVLAVLRDMGCGSSDVVQAMAYCTSESVLEHFIGSHTDALPWPCLAMIGDVCRADLLFEIEVTACPNARPWWCGGCL